MLREPHQGTWLGSDRFLARAVGRPINRFLHIEASGGIILFAAALVALLWANSPWSSSYETLWHTRLSIGLGQRVLEEDLRHWVNDGLMAIFFFIIALEIKNEVVSGDLQTRARAAVPVAAALGGMAAPALLYLAIGGGGVASDGWGIPMATDVAFALGALALLGRRIPSELKVLLLALAIVDDVGAILVIALFYSSDLSLVWLAAAGLGIGAVALLRRARVRYVPVFVAAAGWIWLATFESGVHATIAGVAIGLLTPARALLDDVDADRIADELSSDTAVSAAGIRDVSFRLKESVPMTDRLIDALHPWTSYVIIPVFALANAGVSLSAGRVADAASSRVTIGVVVGLVLGKAVGVAGGIWIAVRSRIGSLAPSIRPVHIIGLALAAGIGFTVSIFMAGLAFADQALVDEAKIGIVVGSTLAALASIGVLHVASRRESGA
jgi:NhaA family Na+:H+ antiporter